jgi:hypothetical protein
MAGATAVSDREEVPDPAREALDEPRLDAEELEREIGDSEEWDEASEDGGSKESYRGSVGERSAVSFSVLTQTLQPSSIQPAKPCPW